MLVAAEFDDGSEMDDGELRDQLMTLLLAGHETTATGARLDLRPAAAHPADARAPRWTSSTAATSEYLDAVIDESLRVRPVVPFTGRLLREPAELGGYELAAGHGRPRRRSTCPHQPRGLSRPVRVPARALPRRRPAETYSWIPFGGGTRRCIGAAFAQLEMRVVLRTILESVRLAPPTRSPSAWSAATSPSRPRTAPG